MVALDNDGTAAANLGDDGTNSGDIWELLLAPCIAATHSVACGSGSDGRGRRGWRRRLASRGGGRLRMGEG